MQFFIRFLKFLFKVFASLCILLLLAMGMLWWMTFHSRTIQMDNYSEGHIAAFNLLADLVERRPLWRPYYEVTAINNGPYMFLEYHIKENVLVYGVEPASGITSYGTVTPEQLKDIISKLPKDPKWEDIHKIISSYPRPDQVPRPRIL